MTKTLYIQSARVKKISLITILLLLATVLSSIFNAHLPSHMQVAFIQTCEARSERDIWHSFFRKEFQRLIQNEFKGVRQLRDTRYDILSHNMWERNDWETDMRYYKVMQHGALSYNGQYVQYANPAISQWGERIKNQILAERANSGLSGGISYHDIVFDYSTDRKIIELLCNTPGSPYRIVKKYLGSKCFQIAFDPNLLV